MRIAASLQREYPKTNAGVTAYAEPLTDRIVSDIRVTLLALLGAVGFLLLIACVNVANLLIARRELGLISPGEKLFIIKDIAPTTKK